MIEVVVIAGSVVAWIGIALVLTRWNADLPHRDRLPWIENEHAMAWPFILAGAIVMLAVMVPLYPIMRLFDWAARKDPE